MRKQGIAYGAVFGTSFLEAQIGLSKTHFGFGLAVTKIRKTLEAEGFFLSGRGQNGHQFVILAASSNADVIQSKCTDAFESLRRAVVLGKATDLSELTRDERRRHTEQLKRAETKLSLISRESNRD